VVGAGAGGKKEGVGGGSAGARVGAVIGDWADGTSGAWVGAVMGDLAEEAARESGVVEGGDGGAAVDGPLEGPVVCPMDEAVEVRGGDGSSGEGAPAGLSAGEDSTFWTTEPNEREITPPSLPHRVRSIQAQMVAGKASSKGAGPRDKDHRVASSNESTAIGTSNRRSISSGDNPRRAALLGWNTEGPMHVILESDTGKRPSMRAAPSWSKQ
jgi:hypothetical protein